MAAIESSYREDPAQAYCRTIFWIIIRYNEIFTIYTFETKCPPGTWLWWIPVIWTAIIVRYRSVFPAIDIFVDRNCPAFNTVSAHSFLCQNNLPPVLLIKIIVVNTATKSNYFIPYKLCARAFAIICKGSINAQSKDFFVVVLISMKKIQFGFFILEHAAFRNGYITAKVVSFA